MKYFLSVVTFVLFYCFNAVALAQTTTSLEEPAAGAIYTGVANIRGWAVADDGIAKISLFIDGQPITDIPRGAVRDDVALAFPAINGSSQSGFSMAYNFSKLDAGAHVIRLVFVDGKGVETEIVRNFFSIRFDSAFITSALDLGEIELDSNSAAITIKNLKIEGVFYDLELGWRKSAQGFAIQKITITPLALLNFATFDTNFGSFVVELDPGNAPITVANFKDYASTDFYDDTLIHRIVPDFVIQGGGQDLTGTLKENRAPITNEATNGLKNIRGTIAMARQTAPHSARSQFFVNLIDNPSLDYVDSSTAGFGYAVFGAVVSGMDVVDEIGRNPAARVIVNSVVLAPNN